VVSATTSRPLRKQRVRDRAAPPTLERPGVAWAVPGLLFFLVFAVAPMVGVLYLSFTHWDGLNPPQFTGTANWSRFFDDSQVWQSTTVTGALLIGNIVVQAPVSILLGVWAAGHQRNRAVLSALFFLPLLLSTAATAVMWRQLLDPNFGLPSKFEWLFGSDPMGTQQGAIACLVLVGGLTAFDIVLLLTNGGPGTDTSILPFSMYQTAFRTYDYGYASAIASFLLLLATAASVLLTKLSGYDKMTSTMEGL
jgi:xylobiose transport system permease protein